MPENRRAYPIERGDDARRGASAERSQRGCAPGSEQHERARRDGEIGARTAADPHR